MSRSSAIGLLLLIVAGLVAVLPAHAATPSPGPGPGPAYWLLGVDGGVFPFGRGSYAGSLANHATNGAPVALAPTPSGAGYWVAANDGGVFSFGDAPFYGSLTARDAHAPVVGIAATRDGHGYWLATANGGVYSFGDAPFHGSAATLGLRTPVLGIAPTPAGDGYWLASQDGGVYAFGAARFYGGAGGLALDAPVISIVPTPTGHGYWLVTADGGVLTYGDAPYLGSAVNQPRRSAVVGMAPTRSGQGYWLATADGGVFSFGDAQYYGSVGATSLSGPIVSIASGSGEALPRTPTLPSSRFGYDVSWPECGEALPPPPYGFAVVGVTDGHLFSTNPCLADEWRWATSYGSFGALYVNSNAFDAAELASFLSGQASSCHGNVGCALYQWGHEGALDALRAARNIPAPMWWLDVETGNEWLPDPAANAVILQAMIDTLHQAGKQVGVYSTSLQWGEIVGNFSPGLPTWIPGATIDEAAAFCDAHSFGAGRAWMVQFSGADGDMDRLCDAVSLPYSTLFAHPSRLAIPEYTPPGPPSSPAGINRRGVQSPLLSQTHVLPFRAPRHRSPSLFPATQALSAGSSAGGVAGLVIGGRRRRLVHRRRRRLVHRRQPQLVHRSHGRTTVNHLRAQRRARLAGRQRITRMQSSARVGNGAMREWRGGR